MSGDILRRARDPCHRTHPVISRIEILLRQSSVFSFVQYPMATASGAKQRTSPTTEAIYQLLNILRHDFATDLGASLAALRAHSSLELRINAEVCVKHSTSCEAGRPQIHLVSCVVLSAPILLTYIVGLCSSTSLGARAIFARSFHRQSSSEPCLKQRRRR